MHLSSTSFKKSFSVFSMGIMVLGLGVLAGQAHAQMKNVQLKGKVAGFPSLVKDDVLHGALVLPSLRPMDILSFQFAELLSPPEPMKAGPMTVKAPGNLYIPTQRESYGILPITLSKESFTVFADAQKNEEWVALQFRAEHSKLLDAMEDKRPYLEYFPLIRIESLGLIADQRYDRDQEFMNISLDHKIQSEETFDWARPAPGAGQADLALMLQQSPAGRWIVTDVQAKIQKQQGKLRTAARLGNKFVGVIGRAQNNAEENLESFAGHFVHFERGQGISKEGIPQKLTGVQHGGKASRALKWDPVLDEGWMAVFHIQKVPTLFGPSKPELAIASASPDASALFAKSLSMVALLGMGGLFDMFKLAKPSSFLGWTSARSGSFELQRNIQAGDKIIALFVGTARPVNQPGFVPLETEDSADEIFSEATNLRLVILYPK